MNIRSIARLIAWSLAAIIVILSLVPPGLRPETGAPSVAEHFVIYFATGLAFGLGYGGRDWPLAFMLITYAACVEIAQLFVPGRHARITDFLIDSLALCIGMLMPLIWRLIIGLGSPGHC